MTATRSSLVDRLAERGFVDRWGFLGFALVGSVAILFAKSLGIQHVLVAVGAATTMVGYALLVSTAGTGRLRADQAGDNCYYLGLIYTLCSLAYAIFLFDPNDTATTIVQGFGIALATTILGLVLRVFFNQSRVDLVQTEDTARIELAEAAGRLKAELSASIVSMNDFSRQTRQSLEELHGQMSQGLQEITKSAAAGISEASNAAQTALVEQGNDSTAKAKRLAAATDKVLSSLERQSNAFDGMDQSANGVAASLAAVQAAAAASEAAMNAIIARSDELASAQGSLSTTSHDLGGVITKLLDSVHALDAAAGRLDQFVTARLSDAQASSEAPVIRAGASLESAIERVRAGVEAFVSAQTDLASRAGAAVNVVERHNAALETELTRSRENVSKVHSALVDMTDELAKRVEAQAR